MKTETLKKYINKDFLVILIFFLLYGYVKDVKFSWRSLLLNIMILFTIYSITLNTIECFGIIDIIKKYTRNTYIKFTIVLLGILLLELTFNILPFIYVSGYTGFFTGIEQYFYKHNIEKHKKR
ncbi:hypothetical protein [Caloranaerobacter ferrireducens]|uniref:hypothetical protein n=1 Tax=Caloranaerobacter ferrireducens TaxID=1323370 RepID=UPI00084D09F3|nr:hypothetical protein [Caloranaerobacter ferrireducens]